MKNNKIGFSNFKSFGEKVQTFSQKPITLIYGPNSIGKSSTLHFLLYMEYLKETGDVDLKTSNFAGDPIDLGGFNNFIHKKNINSKISYHLTLQKESDIGKYFSPLYSKVKKFEEAGVFDQNIIKNFIKPGAFDYIPVKDFDKAGAFDNQSGVKYIIQRIKRYSKKDNTIPFVHKSTVRYLKRIEQLKNQKLISEGDHKTTWQYSLSEFILMNKDILGVPKTTSEQNKVSNIFKNCLTSEVPLQDFLQRDDDQPLDGLDKLILFIAENEELELNLFGENNLKDDASTIWKRYKLFFVLNDIEKITIQFEFGRKGKKAHHLEKYFIDNDLLYSYNSDTDCLEENINNSILHIIKKSGLLSSALIENHGRDYPTLFSSRRELQLRFKPLRENIFFPTRLSSSFTESLHGHIINSIKDYDVVRKPQYLGPIRFLPSRNIKYEKKIPTSIIKEIEAPKTLYSPALYSMRFKNIKFLGKIIRKLNVIIFILKFNKFFKNLIMSNAIILDLINKSKKPNKKISSNNSLNSEQFWENFCNIPDKQKKVNDWLSDDTKLKTPYNIHVRQTKRFKGLNKLFRLSAYYEYELLFIDKRTDTAVTIRDMGLGISQVLPILISTQTLENHKIFIEQPELHLHPAVQCEIADEFIKSKNTQNNEFIIESHSEHLLLRVMKRMRQTAEGRIAKGDELALTPDDVCLLYVDQNDERTYLNELELDNDGSLLDPWPHGFFEEGYKERFD